MNKPLVDHDVYVNLPDRFWNFFCNATEIPVEGLGNHFLNETGACLHMTETYKSKLPEIKQYFSVHFPISAAQSYYFTQLLLQNKAVRHAFSSKEVIRIRDFGAADGGSLCGVLFALEEAGCKNRISVLAQDYNELKKPFIEKTMAGLFPDVSIDYDYGRDSFCEIPADSFSLVIASKSLCEINNTDNAAIYNDFVLAHSKCLENNGLIMVIENTDRRPTDSLFKPSALLEASRSLRAVKCGMEVILPTSCAKWQRFCQQQSSCFHRIAINMVIPHAGGKEKNAGKENTEKYVEKIKQTRFQDVCCFVWAPDQFASKVNSFAPRKLAYRIGINNRKRDEFNYCFMGTVKDEKSLECSQFLKGEAY